MFHQMRVEFYHQDRVDHVRIADRLKNEPVSQCSSNMLSVAPKESAVLSIKYQYFLTPRRTWHKGTLTSGTLYISSCIYLTKKS